MKHWSKILCSCLVGGATIVPFTNTTLTYKPQICNETLTINEDYLRSTYDTSRVVQQLMVDKKYRDKENHDRNVCFENVIKKVYLSPDNRDVGINKLLSSVKQLTVPTCTKDDYGYFQYNDNEQVPKQDLNTRIENWQDVYTDNIYTNLKYLTPFGITPIQLYINTANFWPSNKQISELNVPCAFRNDKYEQYVFNEANDASFNDANLKNDSKNNIVGVPFLKVRDEKIADKKHKTKEHLIAYWLNGSTTNPDGTTLLGSEDCNRLCVGTYDLSHLINLSGASFNQKTIRLTLNQDFLNKAKLLDEYHKKIREELEKPWIDFHKKCPNCEKTIIDNLIDMNVLTPENFKLLYCWPFYNRIYDFVRGMGLINGGKYAASLGFSKLDNPWGIIQDLKKRMKLNFNYAIMDKQQPGQWIMQSKSINFADLENGVDIFVGQKGSNECKFRFDSLVSNEMNTKDVYIGSQTIRKLECTNDLLKQNDNVYEMKKPNITNAEFKNNDVIFNRNYKVNQITNDELLKEYLILKTNYDEAGDWTLLNPDQYQVIRNSHNGSIKIIITINEIQQERVYEGFKIGSLYLHDIDATNVGINLIADDLNDEKIKQFEQSTGFDTSLFNVIHFNIASVDNNKGIAIISIDQCDQDEYLNKTFKIFNLKSYYIKQNKNINSSIMKKNPSEITENEFRKNFIEMSDEFNNRHINDLLISLQPDDNQRKLTSVITFNDVKTNEKNTLTYIYDFNHTSLNFQLLIPIILISLAILLTSGFLIYRKFKKPKLH